jgi:hypothetical protein
MRNPQRFIIYSSFVGFLFLATTKAAENPAIISVTASEPGKSIPVAALGLSFETSRMLPDAAGVHYFRPENHALVQVFQTLGIKSLRIGGNSVDEAEIPEPSECDLTNFFEFARAAGVKVIYSVRLKESTNGIFNSATNAEYAAKVARLIRSRYADTLDCFAIGNEPYYFSNEIYLAKWKAVQDAIAEVYPDAKFCGPDQNPSPQLDKLVLNGLAVTNSGFFELTHHSYPFGCAYKNPKSANNPDGQRDVSKLIPFDAADARERMLSPAAYPIYGKIYAGISNVIAGTPVGYRLTECNSFWFSGLEGASDRAASALWSVDFLYWWSVHDCNGINFHTGDRTGGTTSMPCRYAAFVTSPKGYEVRPLGYGLKLFSLGSHGRQLSSMTSATNLAVYATLDGKNSFVTIINKAHGANAEDQRVKIEFDEPLTRKNPQVIYLRAKNNDLAADSSKMLLGGATIGNDGVWRGKWQKLSTAVIKENTISLIMPPASAAVLEVTLQ